MNELEEQIFNYISVYCDTCRFNKGTQEEWEAKLGWWGCDNCHRKYQGYEPDLETIQGIIKKVKESKE